VPSPRDRRPGEEVLVGAGKVQLFGRAPGPWTIAWYEAESSPRHRTTRASHKKAKALFERKIKELSNRATGLRELSPQDGATHLQALDNLSPTGQSLITATAEHARREKILKDKQITFDALVGFWDENRPRIATAQPLPRVVDEYLADRQGQLSKDHHAHRTHQLNKLAHWYTGPIHQLQRVDVDIWLKSLGVGPITRRGYKEAARELVRYAEACGYVGPNNPLLARAKADRQVVREIKILTIDQVTALLTIRQHDEEQGRAQKSLVPFLAIQLFAGLRHSEAARLDWRDIHFGEHSIYVPKAIGKGGNARVAPISENLAAWLKSYARRSGPVTSLSQISGALTKAKRNANIPAGDGETKNILRHTAISYRMAAIQDIAKVALQSGNSPAIIRKHYGRPMPQEEGKRLFTIYPADTKQPRLPGL
jgi:integrase